MKLKIEINYRNRAAVWERAARTQQKLNAELHTRLEAIEEKLDQHDQEFSVLSGDLDALDDRLDEADKRTHCGDWPTGVYAGTKPGMA